MDISLLKPAEVDLLLRYPIGRAVKLARKGLIPHLILPDGEIRFDQQQIEQLIIRHVLAHAEADLQAVLASEARWRELDAALSARRPKDAHERALIEELQRTVREGFDLVEQAKECQRGMLADTGQVEGGN